MRFTLNLAVSVVFAVTALIYFATVNPSVTFTDSGELAGACSTYGVAHPTGYPLFTLLGFLWTLLPMPLSNVYKLNLLAAIWTSTSALFLFLLVRELLKNVCRETKRATINKKKKIKPEFVSYLHDESTINILAVIVALTYSFALVIWAQAVAIEVYSLQLLLFNIMIYFLIKAYIGTENIKYTIIAVFCIALGFTNHMTTVLIMPGALFLIYKIIRIRESESKKNLSDSDESLKISPKTKFPYILTIAAFLIPLLLYITLPLRSSAMPAFNWGWVHRGLDKFLYHVQGKQYQGWMFSDASAFMENLNEFLTDIPFQFGILGLLLILGSFFIFVRTNLKNIFWFFLINFLVCVIYASNYSIHDIEAYYSLAIISLFPFLAIGAVELMKSRKNLLYALAILPILNFSFNISDNDKSNDYLVHEYTQKLVSALEPNAIIISAQWDYWNSAFIYFREIEGFRTDVTWIGKELMRRTWFPLQLQRWHPNLFDNLKTELQLYSEDLEKFESGMPRSTFPFIQQNYINLFRKIIDTHIDTRPVYITLDIVQTEEDIIKGYEFVPQGLAVRLFRARTVPEDISFDLPDLEKFIKSSKQTKSSIGKSLVEVASHNIFNLGQYEAINQRFENAAKAFEYSLKINPANSNASKALMNIRTR